MRISLHSATIWAMTNRAPTRLTLEVDEVEPIAGRLLDESGRGRSFAGWLGLADALGRHLPGDREAGAEGAPSSRLARAGSAALLAIEALGTLLMWAPIPLAWLWIGGRVYSLTGSLATDLAVAFAGFIGTTLLAVVVLQRVDQAWITLRRRAGHDQENGALSQVAIVSGTIGIALFLLWYYLLAKAFIMPFMPSQ
jgi:hypothetical protein